MLKDIVGQKPADRLMQSIQNEMPSKHPAPLSRRQVAIVLHALADHTAIMAALIHHQDLKDTSWPEATSIGRWLHDVGDQLCPFPFAEEGETDATGN